MTARLLIAIISTACLANLAFYISNPSAPALTSQQNTLFAFETLQTIILDGSAGEAGWVDAGNLSIPAYGTSTQFDVTLKAVHDGTSLFLYASWTDPIANDTRRGWQYNGTHWENMGGNEDRISFSWTNSSSPNACGHIPGSGTGLLFDVWHWKAARTGRFGWADDKYWDASGRHADALTSGGYVDNSVVRQAGSAAEITTKLGNASSVTPFSNNDRPYWNTAGAEINWISGANATVLTNCIHGYNSTPPIGSRGDVTTAALHDGTAWHVEFQRALDTGNSGDDIAFTEGTSVDFYLNYHDNSGGGSHIITSNPTKFMLMLVSGPRVTSGPIKIGALVPLATTRGQAMEAGAKLAVKEINAAGGVVVGAAAHDLELIVETTTNSTTGEANASLGVTNVRKLQEQDDVTAMLGLYRPEVATAVMAELDRPFLGVATSTPITTPYFWRVGVANGSSLTRSVLDFYGLGLGKQQGVRNVTIVRENANWTLSMRNAVVFYLGSDLLGLGFSMNFTDDIVLETDANFTSVNASLAPLKSTYDSLQVNALMTLFGGSAGKHVTAAWASLNLTQYLAGINVEAQSLNYFDETQGAAYGEIELESMPPDVNKTSKTDFFRQAYTAEYGEEPSQDAFISYDAVYVIKDALERANSTYAALLQMALLTTDYEGATYKIKFTNETYTDPITSDTNIAHDLYTRGTIGVIDDTYHQGYYVQWQQGGAKKTVWTRPEETAVTRNLTKHLEWPINHSAHGFITDRFPPTIDSPPDVAYGERTIGNNITWHPVDENPANYTIYQNDSIAASGPWDNSSISISLDNLTLGIYNYTLVARDIYDQWAADTVWVTILDVTPPLVTIESPSNVTYTKPTITINLSGDAVQFWYNLEGTSQPQNFSWTTSIEETNLQNGTYTLNAYGNDSAGNEAHAAVTFTVKINPDVELEIVDRISGPNNIFEVSETIIVSIEVWNTTTLSIQRVSTGPETPSDLDSLGLYLDITLSDPSALVELWINVSFAELPEGQNPQDVHIYYYDEDLGTWLMLTDTGVDSENEIIWARTDHLTTFGMMKEHIPSVQEEAWLIPLAIGGFVILAILGIFAVRYTRLKEQIKQLRKRTRERDWQERM
ncbi:MAG: ethylbenzene dehydrogenase-related protein [Candidatus Heimdallarchaeota archaeon]